MSLFALLAVSCCASLYSEMALLPTEGTPISKLSGPEFGKQECYLVNPLLKILYPQQEKHCLH